MSNYNEQDTVTSVARLEALLGEVGAASRLKEVAFVHLHYRAMIEASPFAVLATNGPDGLDVSPRGDAPGFVVVEDEKTLLLPERRGNNRADSLRNIIADPRIALLFLIPGVGETLRVNGTARIVTAPGLLARFAVGGSAPKFVLEIDVEAVYFQCARAILRSKLWSAPAAERAAIAVPSPGAMLAGLTRGEIDGKAYDQALPARQGSTLY